MHVFLDIVSCHNLYFLLLYQEQVILIVIHVVKHVTTNDNFVFVSHLHTLYIFVSIYQVGLLEPCWLVSMTGSLMRMLLKVQHEHVCCGGIGFHDSIILIKFSVYYILSCCCRFFHIDVYYKMIFLIYCLVWFLLKVFLNLRHS